MLLVLPHSYTYVLVSYVILKMYIVYTVFHKRLHTSKLMHPKL